MAVVQVGRESVAYGVGEQDRVGGQEQPSVAQVRGQDGAQFPGDERVKDDQR